MATDLGRARLTRTADRLHLTLEAVEIVDDDPRSGGRLIRREIDLVAAPNVVVTVHAARSTRWSDFGPG